MGHSQANLVEFAKRYIAKLSLSGHPNYSPSPPVTGETAIAFALRRAAHLLSPPMDSAESNEIECVSAARQVAGLLEELEKQWAQAIEEESR